jgi:hypothetical protein
LNFNTGSFSIKIHVLAPGQAVSGFAGLAQAFVKIKLQHKMPPGLGV